MINNNKPYIICAAIYVDTGEHVDHQPKNIKTGYVVCGRRHCNAIITNMMIHENDFIETKDVTTQGFLTSDDRFVTRQQAGEIAYNAGQIDRKVEKLISEDLY